MTECKCEKRTLDQRLIEALGLKNPFLVVAFTTGGECVEFELPLTPSVEDEEGGKTRLLYDLKRSSLRPKTLSYSVRSWPCGNCVCYEAADGSIEKVC